MSNWSNFSRMSPNLHGEVQLVKLRQKLVQPLPASWPSLSVHFGEGGKALLSEPVSNIALLEVGKGG